MDTPSPNDRSATTGIRRRYWIGLLTILAGLPFVLNGVQKAIDGVRITPEKWMSAEEPERRVFEAFRREFEGNDDVLVSWDGCTIDDPRLRRFEQALLTPDGDAVAPQYRSDYERVVTGMSAVRQLTASPLNLTREEAIARLQGTLIGKDGRTSCALVVLTYDGNERRAESIAQLKQLAQRTTSVDESRLHIAGPPNDGVAIDRETVRGVSTFSTICTLTAALICAISLRSIRLTGVIIGIACFGQGVSLALVYYAGLTLDAILIVIPPLVFVLTVSAGVHLVNYYAEKAANDHGQNPVCAAFRLGWKPCALAAVTTAIGLGSLTVSRVTPVFHFGVIAAVSVLLTTAALLSVLPGELLYRPVEYKQRRSRDVHRWQRFADAIAAHGWLVVLVCFTVMVVAADGLRRLSTSVDALSIFSADSRITRDYRWFESNIGPVVPVEIAVDFAAENPLGFRQRVELVDRAQRALQHVKGVTGVISALTFSPEIPKTDDTASFLKTSLTYRRMQADRNSYVKQNYLYEDDRRQSWRITGHVSALAGADYAHIQRQLSRAVESTVASSEHTAGIGVRCTGMMPLIQHIQTVILTDLFRSFVTAFVCIAVAVGIVLRSFRLTFIAMLPNLFPVAVIFGGMGWLGIPANIGTVMTASVALGIAVDDTIHFLNSYRRTLRPGTDNATAVRHALVRSGRAMLETSMICAAGMLVFTFSSFVPTFQFGLVMALALMTALVGDLVFLPALLDSALARRFAGTGAKLAGPRQSAALPDSEWPHTVGAAQKAPGK